MLSAICFNLEQSKILSSGNGLNVAIIIFFPVFDRMENTVGKGENAGYQHFLLFPQNFQKLYFSELLKIKLVG